MLDQASDNFIRSALFTARFELMKEGLIGRDIRADKIFSKYFKAGVPKWLIYFLVRKLRWAWLLWAPMLRFLINKKFKVALIDHSVIVIDHASGTFLSDYLKNDFSDKVFISIGRRTIPFRDFFKCYCYILPLINRDKHYSPEMLGRFIFGYLLLIILIRSLKYGHFL